MSEIVQAAIPKMRTVDGILDSIRKMDPGTQISRNMIRQIFITGKVKTVMAGSKRLADLDDVLNYLRNPPEIKENPESSAYGTLRKIQ